MYEIDEALVRVDQKSLLIWYAASLVLHATLFRGSFKLRGNRSEYIFVRWLERLWFLYAFWIKILILKKLFLPISIHNNFNE